MLLAFRTVDPESRWTEILKFPFFRSFKTSEKSEYSFSIKILFRLLNALYVMRKF